MAQRNQKFVEPTACEILAAQLGDVRIGVPTANEMLAVAKTTDDLILIHGMLDRENPSTWKLEHELHNRIERNYGEAQ